MVFHIKKTEENVLSVYSRKDTRTEFANLGEIRDVTL